MKFPDKFATMAVMLVVYGSVIAFAMYAHQNQPVYTKAQEDHRAIVVACKEKNLPLVTQSLPFKPSSEMAQDYWYRVDSFLKEMCQ